MAETFDDFFISLLFGQGNLIGLLLIIAFFILLTLAWKYAPVMLIPTSLIFAITYIQHDLIWNTLIMLAFTMFSFFHAARELK